MIYELSTNKIFNLGKVLSTKQVNDINNYLDKNPIFGGHIYRGFETYSETASCYKLETIICAPYLLELGIGYTPMAQEYLNHSPIYLYSMNIFNTFPAVNTQGDIQEFHRDSDDEKFVGLFIYLTDVDDAQEGAHQFKYNDKITTILGPAGTAFMADTSEEHRGIKPNKNRRIVWIRWCINKPPRTYVQDNIQPIDKALLGNRYNINYKDLLQLLII